MELNVNDLLEGTSEAFRLRVQEKLSEDLTRFQKLTLEEKEKLSRIQSDRDIAERRLLQIRTALGLHDEYESFLAAIKDAKTRLTDLQAQQKAVEGSLAAAQRPVLEAQQQLQSVLAQRDAMAATVASLQQKATTLTTRLANLREMLASEASA